MEQDLLAKLYLSVQEKIEEEMNKVCDMLLEQFTEQLKIQKNKAISEVMKNVIVAFYREADGNINYSITFKNVVNKEK